MRRRHLLGFAASLPLLGTLGAAPAAAAPSGFFRVRPGDSAWPGEAEWDALRQQVGGNLIQIRSPLDACAAAPDGDACRDLFRSLKNPYAIGDSPALTQTCAWVDAWTAQPSAYTVAAHETAHVVAARRDAARIGRATAELRRAAPDTGAYIAESSYFQADWQAAYWGANYPRLLAAKQRYDPDGLFFVRHGVGSEGWSEDGFERGMSL